MTLAGLVSPSRPVLGCGGFFRSASHGTFVLTDTTARFLFKFTLAVRGATALHEISLLPRRS
ncbi:hypothetical protein V1291_004840 [Nitrobacteraceae bacterium AZCC 1564]